MLAIEVENLTKIYSVFQKEPGFAGSVKSLLHRKYQKILEIRTQKLYFGFIINLPLILSF